MKALIEKRNSLLDEMDTLLANAKTEVRAMNDTETSRFDEIKTEIASIDKTLNAEKEVRAMEIKETPTSEPVLEQRSIDEKELREIFTMEKRAAANTATPNQGGVVVNSELTGEIIKALKDRSDAVGFFNMTTIQGNAKIPKKTSGGAATWEDQQMTPNGTDKATVPTIEVVELGQNRLYRESAITQQMLNSQEIDVRGFIIDDVSESMADGLENAIFNGTGVKQPTGLINGINTNKKTSLGVRGTITIEDLKKCKAKIKKSGLKGAKWYMHSNTLLELDLLKDTTGRPLLQPDLTQESNYTLLGLPVETTDYMPDFTAVGAQCVAILASPNAYHLNVQKSLSLNIYDDSTYKRAGLIGFGSDMYVDGKVKNDDVLAGIFNKA